MTTDGGDRAAGNAGNLLVGQALKVVQDDSDTLRWRQGRDGLGNGVNRQATLNALRRLVSRAGHIA